MPATHRLPTYAVLIAVLLLAQPLVGAETVDVATLHERGLEELRAGEHAAAAATFATLLATEPTHATAHYNLACAHALQGQSEQALASLRQAVTHGYRDLTHLRRDPDLQSLHQLESFTALCEDLVEANKPRYEPGAAIPGIRSVEGDPDDGLRYRLRIDAAAKAEQPHRLIIWLHPSGASANKPVEALAPKLAAQGYALLVFTRKQWRGWTAAEGEAALASLAHLAAAEPAVDVERPILMGFSAGGQQALKLWREQPDRFGGLLLNAAYPIVIEGGGYSLIQPPADATTPILVLSGSEDNGTALWRSHLADWNAQGLRVHLHEVPDKGHTFLFAGPAMDTVTEWLAGLDDEDEGQNQGQGQDDAEQ
ncbi:MAG: TPR end-of-group domain-containing protein [Planctomycetota bacterium]